MKPLIIDKNIHPAWVVTEYGGWQLSMELDCKLNGQWFKCKYSRRLFILLPIYYLYWRFKGCN